MNQIFINRNFQRMQRCYGKFKTKLKTKLKTETDQKGNNETY